MTTSCPPIIAFVAVGVKPPRWCARYASGSGFLPMVFDGPSMEAVTARAAAFWAAETAKQEALGIARAARVTKMQAARRRAPVDDDAEPKAISV